VFSGPSGRGKRRKMLALREEKTTHNLAPVGIRQKFSWAMGPFGLWGEKQAILTLRYSPGGQGAEERHGIIEPCVPKGVRSPNFIYSRRARSLIPSGQKSNLFYFLHRGKTNPIFKF